MVSADPPWRRPPAHFETPPFRLVQCRHMAGEGRPPPEGASVKLKEGGPTYQALEGFMILCITFLHFSIDIIQRLRFTANQACAVARSCARETAMLILNRILELYEKLH